MVKMGLPKTPHAVLQWCWKRIEKHISKLGWLEFSFCFKRGHDSFYAWGQWQRPMPVCSYLPTLRKASTWMWPMCTYPTEGESLTALRSPRLRDTLDEHTRINVQTNWGTRWKTVSHTRSPQSPQDLVVSNVTRSLGHTICSLKDK